MALVRACGGEFYATPLRQIDDTTWEMRAEQHGARVTPGTIIHVKINEIILMDSTEVPKSDGLAELEAAMAEERKTIKNPREILAELLDTIRTKAKNEGWAEGEASVSKNPT